jgi:hypothetical protein
VNQDGRKRGASFGLAPRARNKTVVLTPELASRVRASVGQKGDSEGDGFVRPGQTIRQSNENNTSYNGASSAQNPSSHKAEQSSEQQSTATGHLSSSANRTAASALNSATNTRSGYGSSSSYGAAGLGGALHVSESNINSQRPSASSSAGNSSFSTNDSLGRSPQHVDQNTLIRPTPGYSSESQYSSKSESGEKNITNNIGSNSTSTNSSRSNGVQQQPTPRSPTPYTQTPQPAQNRSVADVVTSRANNQSGVSETSRLASTPRSNTHRTTHDNQMHSGPTSMLVGFLVSFQNSPFGEAFEIREGRTIISSDLPTAGGSVLLIEDPSVGSMHAVIKAESAGTLVLLDQLSETGTFVRKFESEQEEELAGDRMTIDHGDMVRFGSRTFRVSLL